MIESLLQIAHSEGVQVGVVIQMQFQVLQGTSFFRKMSSRFFLMMTGSASDKVISTTGKSGPLLVVKTISVNP